MKLSKIILLLIVALFIFSGCNKDDKDPPEEQVTFIFKHYVGNEEVEFNTIKYTNAFGNLYSVATLKYFISDIRLTQIDGSEVFFDVEHYVDALDNTTLSFTPEEKIQRVDYLSISFIFGLNEEKNVNGRFPNPPESNMEWPLALGPGYHYMKLEGKVDSPATINNYQAHTGATNGNQNYIEVTLPVFIPFANDDVVEFVIKMDINKWWESPNIFDLNEMTMVMGNQEVQKKLQDNGMDVFSLMEINQ